MPMIVDAALVTRKGKNAEFNTGSINAAGKTWQREKIHSDKGVFVAGRAENAPYYAVASSEVKGIAETAVTLFNDFASVLEESTENKNEVLSSFFKTFADFIKENAGLEPSSFGMAVLSGRYDTVHIGLSGNASAYRLSDGILSVVNPDYEMYGDGVTRYGVAECSGVRENDIFLLLGDEAAKAVDAQTVNNICAGSNGDIQLILRRLAGAAISLHHDNSVSLVAVKILAVEKPPVAPVAPVVTPGVGEVFEFENNNDTVISSPDDGKTAETADRQPDPLSENSGTDDGNKKRTAAFIAVAIVLAVLVLLLGLIAIRGIIHFKGEKNPTVTTAETTEESTTAQEETTSAEEETTTAEETTATEETTTRRTVNETTTRRKKDTNDSTTVAPTEKPTEPPTEESTEKPTEDETDAPATDATEASTEEPTEKPTENPTEKPTEKPTEETKATIKTDEN